MKDLLQSYLKEHLIEENDNKLKKNIEKILTIIKKY